MRVPYPFNEIIAQSNMYEMSGFGKLKMIGKEVCLEIENVDILDKCTQKNVSGTHIVNFLRKENKKYCFQLQKVISDNTGGIHIPVHVLIPATASFFLTN